MNYKGVEKLPKPYFLESLRKDMQFAKIYYFPKCFQGCVIVLNSI